MILKKTKRGNSIYYAIYFRNEKKVLKVSNLIPVLQIRRELSRQEQHCLKAWYLYLMVTQNQVCACRVNLVILSIKIDSSRKYDFSSSNKVWFPTRVRTVFWVTMLYKFHARTQLHCHPEKITMHFYLLSIFYRVMKKLI